MPPLPKFTKEDVLFAAYGILKENGIGNVTASNLKASLGTSASPIFTLFDSLAEIKKELKEYSLSKLSEYLKGADAFYPQFKMRGMMFISFAKENPNVFRYIFSSDGENRRPCQCLFLEFVAGSFGNDIKDISKIHSLTEEAAKRFFFHMWIHSFGIAHMIVSGMFSFSDEQIATLLGEEYAGMIKAGEDASYSLIPVSGENEKIDKLKTEFKDKLTSGFYYSYCKEK